MDLIEAITLLEVKKLSSLSKNDREDLLLDVADYLTSRFRGDIADAKAAKKDLDKTIKNKNLDSNEVFFYFGNPDNPKEVEQVKKEVTKFSGNVI